MRAARLRNARLYLVLDRQVSDETRMFEILKAAVRAGVDVVQLRDKISPAKDIVRFSRRVAGYLRKCVPFILNDRADLALAAGADGVHVGQDDLAISAMPSVLRKRLLVGVSCQTMAQALQAQRQGADYIGFGSVFSTLTKPDRRPMDLKMLSRVCRRIEVPVFAIGGIRAGDVASLKALGVDRIAVTRAVMEAEDPAAAVREFQFHLLSKVGSSSQRRS